MREECVCSIAHNDDYVFRTQLQATTGFYGWLNTSLEYMMFYLKILLSTVNGQGVNEPT